MSNPSAIVQSEFEPVNINTKDARKYALFLRIKICCRGKNIIRRYILYPIFFLSAVLSGCGKPSEIADQIKGKSPWTYSEEVDKLNNSKIFIAKREFIKSVEGTAQADVNFQCDAKKILRLKVKTYDSAVENGVAPGISLLLTSLNYSYLGLEDLQLVFKKAEFDYFKTRNGDLKLAFPAIIDKNFSNVAHLTLTGVKIDSVRTTAIEEKLTEYKLAADRKKIPEFFKANDWVIEVPTEGGIIIIEIELDNKDIQKVFEACLWVPDFLKSNVQPVVAQDLTEAKPTSILPQNGNNDSAIDTCITMWVDVYRREKNDQEAMVSADMLNEWKEWCKKGKSPSS